MLLVMLLTTATAWAWSGSGNSENDPILITSAADLTQLATDVNGGESYSNMYFKQTADITLSGEWTPIGTQSNPFKGHYDGGGFAIRGLRVTGNYKHAGLFGYISSDRYHGSQIFIELKNINIVDCVIDVGTVESSVLGAGFADFSASVANNNALTREDMEPLQTKNTFYILKDGETFEARESEILSHLKDKEERRVYRGFTRSAEILYGSENSMLNVYKTFFLKQ